MHIYRQFLRPGSVIVIAVVVGVAVAILKGGDADVRNVLGNVSAPRRLLPFFAGMLGRGPLPGGLIGAATTIAALIGFYVAQAYVLDLGNYPWLRDLALTVRIRITSLPEGDTWRHVYGVGWLAGVGFTMSIFVAELACDTEELLSAAKIGILVASTIAGVAGWLVLRLWALKDEPVPTRAGTG